MIILDLETTGLNPKIHHILEVAAIRVDNNLDEVERYEAVLRLPPTVVSDLHPTVIEMHINNGLLLECSKSEISIADADYYLAQMYLRDGGKAYLAGDSIHFDRKFMEAHMWWSLPNLHHRMVDTSSFRVAAELWGKPVAPMPPEPAHRAMVDCEVSLSKLRFYRDTWQR